MSKTTKPTEAKPAAAKKPDPFKETIKAYLEKRAAEDELFAVTYAKPNKNIDDCCTYILNQVKSSGRQGFNDDEIFGMAVHFYDEDDVKPGDKFNGTVVVNHSVELTEEDKALAKEKAIEEVTAALKEDVKKDLEGKVQLTEEDQAEVRQRAIDLAVAEARDKMTTKKKPVAKKSEPAEENTLF